MAPTVKTCSTCPNSPTPANVELVVNHKILENVKLENLQFNDGVATVKEPTIKVKT